MLSTQRTETPSTHWTTTSRRRRTRGTTARHRAACCLKRATVSTVPCLRWPPWPGSVLPPTFSTRWLALTSCTYVSELAFHQFLCLFVLFSYLGNHRSVYFSVGQASCASCVHAFLLDLDSDSTLPLRQISWYDLSLCYSASSVQRAGTRTRRHPDACPALGTRVPVHV